MVENKENNMPIPQPRNPLGMYSNTSIIMAISAYAIEPSEASFLKIVHGLSEGLNGKHYDKRLALFEISNPHWTVDEIEELSKDKHFKESVTEWDKFMAYNTMYERMHDEFDEQEIIKLTFSLWFSDNVSEGAFWNFISMNI